MGFLVLVLFISPLFMWAQSGGAGRLRTYVEPGTAGVFVDGKYLGSARNFGWAKVYSLPAGEHELLLTDPRCQDFSARITIQPGKTTKVTESMVRLPVPKPPFGRLRIEQGSNDKFGAVFLNDKYMGHIDEFSNSSQGLLIAPGNYQLRIASATGSQEYAENIAIRQDQTTKIKPVLK